MKYLKILGAAAFAVAALTAFAGASPASATVLCHTNTTPCTSKFVVGDEIAANLKTGTKGFLKAGFAVTECEESMIAAKMTNAGSSTTTVEAELTTLTFSKCNCSFIVFKKGNLIVHWTEGTANGTVTTAGFEIEVKCGEIKPCVYAGEVSAGQDFTGGNSFVISASEAPIPKKSGPATCNNPSKWTATYEGEGTNKAAWVKKE